MARLAIRDFVLIEALTLEMSSGLNVFTGETGAGKSILLDALGLALGGRGDAGAVKSGAAQAAVAAEFTGKLPDAVLSIAEENAIVVEDPLILRRVVGRDGKSRAFIGDQPVTAALLRRVGDALIETLGQFDTHGLLDSSTHRGMLDDFAGTGALARETAAAFAVWREAERELREAESARVRAAEEEDFLSAAMRELDALDPREGEGDALAERRARLMNSAKIMEALRTASAAIDGDKGAVATLALAGKNVARAAEKAEGFGDLLAAIDKAADAVAEASGLLERAVRDMEGGEGALEEIEERFFALRAAARKHGVTTDELPDMRCRLRERLDALEDGGSKAAVLAKRVGAARMAYAELAEKLGEKRRKAAKTLAAAVVKELKPLKLERARFVVDVAALPEEQWNAAGRDRVAFLASANPGIEPDELRKAASGGELARFMLALKVVMASGKPAPVMVFDEVDSGIGGATASAVGDRLARLAENGAQVLVVTHSPQVAARGDHHFRVSKLARAASASTEVVALGESERVEEIARMLSAAAVTPAAREAARSLLGKDAANGKISV